MNRDVGSWAKSCIQCQRAKVQRHVISDLGRFSPSERFGHIHVDIVGPLPTTADDYKYLLTIIDRCTGWPEAFPMKDISADSVAKVVFEGWIARYGCPSKLISDQGKQFESNLFHKLTNYWVSIKSAQLRITHKVMAWWSDGIAPH
ncbi:Retrovirus-related Pol polyprotein from transposon 412 [Eumeta japonica]|uniref:Retrovirus-related Pol polyprotein from transposon 412 n=1 Tax=Eumeta variegata TaxID=151549 RepID=A0A4C1WGR7_EUMVA|nr:Retrovirus-related Pol polyprotein from transposon 412 [Eumeta japonica]